MARVSEAPLPETALLQTYHQRPGCYADCYAVELPGKVSFADYVVAFYTTPLFKLERVILRVTVRRPSTDGEVRALAEGRAERFAAWDVEGREVDQLLLCDMAAKTRSWLMVEPTPGGTRLYFGSAVVPGGNGKLGVLVHALMGFHKAYSRALLGAAVRRLR
ncbi:hypothetical protein [Aliiroseovarius sp.]|uniref:hypothetical protein n=1 Tax=Aliiroseovarius sp. TaxID=1872442 RepID=UPI003BA8762F